ncbi:b-box zinc finger protein [Anaeramoeba flamelloides]|uniref:B-box zinc finger protein n=1 Tax=Anaeramoeba flamelloides TaxID=1746091 RepID=A0ABQ8Z5V2_9EUKA|nr:b-box zinc finger protein [Anaeramoeba flamelloides]
MNKSRSSQKKNQKSQGPKRLRDIQIPAEPQIPQCEVCEEKKADFYCSIDKVHYCQNCELEVHTSFLKKKHKEFIFQEPYDPRKDKKTIKLIRESNEIIEKDEEEREKEKSEEIRRLNQREIQRLEEEKREKIKEIERREREEYEEEFDPKMNLQNRIELKNENKTAWNPSSEDCGRICGKKIYSRGKHQIKIKIDQFPKPENEMNMIVLGVIKTENMENLIKNRTDWEKTYYFESYFQTWWDGRKNISQKQKKENGKIINKMYPEEIILKKNDIFTILLDMDQKKISFKINEKKLEGWENLPEKVNFFASFFDQYGKEKNQITII